MSTSIKIRWVLAAGAAGLFALSVPATAQSQDASEHMPMCSATVTDHCMQREGRDGAHAATGRHHHHAMRVKHHHHRHHKAHAMSKAAAAAPAKH